MDLRCLFVTCVIVMTSSVLESKSLEKRDAHDIDDFLRQFNELSRFDRQHRPVEELDARLDLDFKYKLINIENIDTANGILTLRAWYDWQWTDHYLQWDQSEYPVTHHRVQEKDIWLPDIVPFNGLEERIDDMPVVISSDGHVVLIRPVTHRFQCVKQDAGTYVCTLKFGSWTYSADYVYLKDTDQHGLPNGLNEDYFMASPRWNVTDRSSRFVSTTYPGVEEEYMHLEISLTLERRQE